MSDGPTFGTSEVAWTIRHRGFALVRVAAEGAWIGGAAISVVGSLAAARFGGDLAPTVILGGFLLALLSPLAAVVSDGWRARLRADPMGLTIERPRPFRTRRWSWDQIDRIEAEDGGLVVVETGGRRVLLTAEGEARATLDQVAAALDSRDGTRSAGDRSEVPPPLHRRATWIRQ